MVKLVDAFFQVHGRAPTMQEIDTMAALQKDKDKLRELKKRVERGGQAKQKAYQRTSSMLRAPRNALMVNRMLKRDVSLPDIAYFLDISDRGVSDLISDWRLPREEE